MKTLKQYIEKHWLLIENSVRNRLYDKGTYANGKPIKTFSAESGVYALTTQNTKSAKRQPIDRVTLKDSGELYESFDMQAGSNSFAINYDDDKGNGKVSDNIPEMEEAIALGQDGIVELQGAILPEMREDYKNELYTILTI